MWPLAGWVSRCWPPTLRICLPSRWWKGRTDFHKLSSDLHILPLRTQAHKHTYNHKVNKCTHFNFKINTWRRPGSGDSHLCTLLSSNKEVLLRPYPASLLPTGSWTLCLVILLHLTKATFKTVFRNGPVLPSFQLGINSLGKTTVCSLVCLETTFQLALMN